MVLGWLHLVPPVQCLLWDPGWPGEGGVLTASLPGLSKPCPTGGTLRSPAGCCRAPWAWPLPPAQHFLQCKGQEERKPGENESSEKRKAGRARENPVSQRGRQVRPYRRPACGRARAWQEEEAEGGPGWATVRPACPRASTSAAPPPLSQATELPTEPDTRQAPGAQAEELEAPVPAPRAGERPRRPGALPGAATSTLPNLPCLEGWCLRIWPNGLAAVPNSPPGSCLRCSFGRRCQEPPAEARSEKTGTACKGGR